MKACFTAIVKQHLPRGYRLSEVPADGRGYEAQVSSLTRTITCRPIEDNYDLFIFLHECGHVHLKHVGVVNEVPTWRDEFEADQYAIAAIKASKFSMDRECAQMQKRSMQEIIHFTREYKTDEHVDDEVLKYAFGRDWRRHR